ncbi:hypothetical protein BD289DRAFT_211985 [Coniella lustricola]|uniref:C2H2-type domain-containing protein n=1 Tax=Coniella lustricola TaxID=2025994 RepID=A0A2T2ZS76_9PEZI|nr:hypothetical protein BD289DRAFT_211985 [Coniella lustricola]
MVTAMMSSAHEMYDPDAVVPQNSPLLVARRVNTQPSPSPEFEVPLSHVSPPPKPGQPKTKRRKVRPSQGDAVLIGYMGNGADPDIAARAGQSPLVTDMESSSASDSEGYIDDTDSRNDALSPTSSCALADTALAALAFGSGRRRSVGEDKSTSPPPGSPAQAPVPPTSVPAPITIPIRVPTAATSTGLFDREADGSRYWGSPESLSPRLHTAVRRDDRPEPVFLAPYSPGSIYSPRCFASPTASLGHGELPPIQSTLPRSESNAGLTLPSLKESLGSFSTDQLSPQSFSQSPPGIQAGLQRLPSISHASSPPISPQDMLSRSPHQPIMAPGTFYPYLPNGMQHHHRHRHSVDYNGSTPSDQSIATPATNCSVAERMNLEGVAFSNPAEGQYTCTFEGCKAQPFQTQYLLNSHANVHSQARPHYCPVAGCTRSEGGKGFKRKNEMIRHGLVHQSPGYVCPFCPDREHKYPRPDNLQRHVRVHHPDKDKDDALLRDVLSQRPDGPSRGRRRRGPNFRIQDEMVA